MRLNKYLAETTGLSRRQADEKIAAGQVLVNNQKPVLGAQVTEKDEVKLDGKTVKSAQKSLENPTTTIILNKPTGYVSSRAGQGRPTVYDLLPEKYQNLKTVGRLDQNSSGLILLTNNGDLAHRLTHPKFAKTKVYEVELEEPLQPLHQQMISDFGINLADGRSQLTLEEIEPLPNLEAIGVHPSPQRDSRRTARASATKPVTTGLRSGAEVMVDVDRLHQPRTRTHWRVTMQEGRNRQIRRTFRALNYHVRNLHRTHFGPYALGDLKEGEFRET